MQINEKLIERLQKNRFFIRYEERGIKEGLFSDMAGALGHLQKNIVKCAYPELIGRKIISTAITKEPMERFPIDSKSVAYEYAEGAATRLSGEKYGAVTINCNILAECSEQWSAEFLEDTTWNVFDNITRSVSKALAVDETTKVIALYNNIGDGDLAGGGALDQDNMTMDWNAVSALHEIVRKENIRPNVLVLNEKQVHQLLMDNKFIEYDYLPSSSVDLEAVSVRKVLGMDVVSSTLVPNGTAYAINTHLAGMMLIRRDITVKDWNDAKTDQYGVRATTRFGLGILKSNAIGKMVNIKSTL